MDDVLPGFRYGPRMTDLTRAALWTRMRFLLDRLIHSIDSETFVDECLDTLLELLGGDRGIVQVGRPTVGWRIVGARHRRRRDLSAVEKQEISSSAVDEALNTGRCVVWEPAPAQDDGSRMSMLDLGIVTALAAPLRHAKLRHGPDNDRIQGVIYMDFRGYRAQVGELHKEFFEAAVVLVAAVLDMRERLHLVREDLRVAKAHRIEKSQKPTLEELLQPKSLDSIRSEVDTCIYGSSPVLVLGESGSGKTLLATLLAEASGRTPVVRATLGASDDLNTITSELFGHERGAFSGAVSKRTGLVEHADGGTLILDEILNLPPHAQQLLLDFTQFGTYRPLGYQGREPKKANVRIIAATNGNILQAIQDTRFRQDLYFRLAAVTITMPPLRTRREEIPGIAEAYLRRTDPQRAWSLTLGARRLLLSPQLEWAGNIRELEGVMGRARDQALAEVAGGEVSRIDAHHLHVRTTTGIVMPVSSVAGHARLSEQPAAPENAEDEDASLREGWERMVADRDVLLARERELIEASLKRFRGVISHAAKEFGVSRTSLMSRMDTLGIDRHEFRR